MFPARHCHVVMLCLHANGISSYRDAAAMLRWSQIRGYSCGIFTDSLLNVSSPSITLIPNKTCLIRSITHEITQKSHDYDILFVLSAHGYRTNTHDYIECLGQTITDEELHDAVVGQLHASSHLLALVDTCHSGSMMHLRIANFTPCSFPSLQNVRKISISACNDLEQAGESISDFAGWGGKLIGNFLDYTTRYPGQLNIERFFNQVYILFSSQSIQATHPILSFES